MPEILFQINPDRNIPWNKLPLLPINSQLYRNPDVLEKLGEAKAALARLQGRSVIIPNQGLLINTICLQEAKASSAIENIFTTDDELYKAYSEKHNEINGTSKEVMKYREAIWHGYQYLEEKKFFDVKYLIETFQIVKETNDEIRPDFIETQIIQRGSGTIGTGKAVYTPPRGKKIIEEKLDNLIEFVNDDQKYKIDHLIKMAIAHYQFEAIHPFRDGNGRTGRIFNIHYLTNKGLIDKPILFLSKFILENKEAYYSALNGVTQRGDWKTWLMYMLKAIEITSDITYQKINNIMNAKDSILNFIKTEHKKIRKADLLIEMIFTQPFSKVKHFQESKLYSEGVARESLNKLCELKILDKKTMEGHHYYENIELTRILSE